MRCLWCGKLTEDCICSEGEGMEQPAVICIFIEARKAHQDDPKDQTKEYAYAAAFFALIQSEKDRGWLAWHELCEGVDAMFSTGMNDDIPVVLEWMKQYAKDMSS